MPAAEPEASAYQANLKCRAQLQKERNGLLKYFRKYTTITPILKVYLMNQRGNKNNELKEMRTISETSRTI